MKQVTLPNNQQVWALNKLETAMLYHEIYVMQSYAKHGIRIGDCDCVFDIGANIGLYSLYLAQSCPTVRVFAFEPIPDIFAVLQRNIQTVPPTLNATLLPVGLSDKPGSALFEFDPASTMTTTMRQNDVQGSIDKNANVTDWLRAGIVDMQRIGHFSDAMATFALRALSNPITKPFTIAALLAPLVWSDIRKKFSLRRVESRLTTISDIIREHQLDTVHLAKIDVEGSELDIINGINADDWSKIRQFVVEVHDVDGRVNTIKELFEQHGYQTVIDQEDWALHKLLGIFTVYAKRA